MSKTPKEYHVGNIFRRAESDYPLGIYILAAVDERRVALIAAQGGRVTNPVPISHSSRVTEDELLQATGGPGSEYEFTLIAEDISEWYRFQYQEMESWRQAQSNLPQNAPRM